MRRFTLTLLLIVLAVVLILLNRCRTLISLLFEDKSADAIPIADIPPPGSPLIDELPQLIPKIIHQTYINETIPDRWKAGQQACIDLHPDYEYKLWTDESSRNFIAEHYPWFLKNFDSYPYPIQRADAIRYFILSHYGGIYLDLDDGCKRKLDPLLQYPAWLRSTVPTGISNDAMGSVPQHPFFQQTIESLEFYNRNWLAPYITIMYSTGPLFLSVIWKEYIPTVTTPEARIRILMPDEYSKTSWAFFNISKGNSWHQGDADTIFWMGQHWIFLTVLGFSIAGAVGLCFFSSLTGSKHGKPGRRNLRSILAFWTRHDEPSYELISRIA